MANRFAESPVDGLVEWKTGRADPGTGGWRFLSLSCYNFLELTQQPFYYNATYNAMMSREMRRAFGLSGRAG